MAIVPTSTETPTTKASLPRRIATYITSMNFSKVFRRHHHHHPKSPSPSTPKTPDQPFFIHPHHRYPRPFSYHIPHSEQVSPLSKTSNVIPYRIGLSSDRTLLTQGPSNDRDEIVRLPMKNGRDHSPKGRKDRRSQSQLNANKRWLFRSMETLDGWKGKVFSPKTPTSNSNQSRSRSVENLADQPGDRQPPVHSQQRAGMPTRSIEAITNRVINSIGIHRKAAHATSPVHETRSPTLTIKKQHPSHHEQNNSRSGVSASAILDFRELSSLSFLHSQSRLNEYHENLSSTTSDNRLDDLDSSHQENDEIISHTSLRPSTYDQQNEIAADPWDFSITWIDSLKEQNSPQQKVQLYENLIQLLEQDTLNIDELLVLRKVLARIWPTEPTVTTNGNHSTRSNEPKSLRLPNQVQQRPKVPAMSQHMAQRCSAMIEPSTSSLADNYESLHDQQSGHDVKPASLLISAKARPYSIENDRTGHMQDHPAVVQQYPSHLNPFQDEKETVQEPDQQNNDSIRRYFERLTLLETIYEKLNRESNKAPAETNNRPVGTRIESGPEKNQTPTSRVYNQPEIKKTTNRFIEMNVDGNGSVASSRSSLKRRAPTAPHVSQTNLHQTKDPPMFTLSSIDLHLSTAVESPKTRTNRWTSSDDHPKERTPPSMTVDTAASCDDNGHVFVYDPPPEEIHHNEPATIPRKTERIQQWLSTCDAPEDAHLQNHRSQPTPDMSPPIQLKMRCIAKPVRSASTSPAHVPKLTRPTASIDMEPARFRTCLKITLDTNESSYHRHHVSPSPTDHYLNDTQAVFL